MLPSSLLSGSLHHAGFAVVVFSFLLPARAAVVTYTPDANTLHLWHLDESGAPAADAGTDPLALPNLAGGATLGDASYPGFGTALNTFDSGLAGSPASTDAVLSAFPMVNGVGDNTTLTYAGSATGAFTFDAVVRLDVDLTQTFAGTIRGTSPMHIVSGEQDGTGGGVRAWQLRLDPVGFNPNADGVTTPLTSPALEFINVNNGAAPVQNRVVLLPTTGSNAVGLGWYHVAVAYDGNAGTPDNLSIYWTRIEDGRTQADLLIQRQLDTDLPVGAVDFTIGNIGRSPSASNFLGLIDEVRISEVARTADGFVFAIPEPTLAIFALMGSGLALRRRRGRMVRFPGA